MKAFSLKSAVCGGLLVIAGLFPASVMAKTEQYTLDPTHTEVIFSWSHLGFSNPTGKFSMVSGTLDIDFDEPEKSVLDVKLSFDNMATGVQKMDEELKGDKFFKVKEYPTATFKSTAVKLTDKNKADVTGNLTLKGISKPVVLHVTFNQKGENFMKQPTAGFSATGSLKRSDFMMSEYVPMVSDDIQLTITAEVNKVDPTAKK